MAKLREIVSKEISFHQDMMQAMGGLDFVMQTAKI
jgi:hypothetical protein